MWLYTTLSCGCCFLTLSKFLIVFLKYDVVVFISFLPASITKSDSGQDSSSPSTTPHTRGYSSSSTAPPPRAASNCQGPPTLALAQPQPPRVPPTSSHAPHLGPPYPLSTPDVLAQGMTAVPPPSHLHPGLLSTPMLQSAPGLIKVRKT